MILQCEDEVVLLAMSPLQSKTLENHLIIHCIADESNRNTSLTLVTMSLISAETDVVSVLRARSFSNVVSFNVAAFPPLNSLSTLIVAACWNEGQRLLRHEKHRCGHND